MSKPLPPENESPVDRGVVAAIVAALAARLPGSRLVRIEAADDRRDNA